jgi:hypothetical protein
MQLLMRRPQIDEFVSIAAPANRFDFSFLEPRPPSDLFIHGDLDRVAPLKEVIEQIDELKTYKDAVIEHAVVPGANNFFEDRLEPLILEVGAYLDKRLGEPARIAIPARATGRRDEQGRLAMVLPVLEAHGGLKLEAFVEDFAKHQSWAHSILSAS